MAKQTKKQTIVFYKSSSEEALTIYREQDAGRSHRLCGYMQSLSPQRRKRLGDHIA